MSIWQIVAMPFWLLGGFSMLCCFFMLVCGSVEVARADAAGARTSFVSFIIWLLIAGIAFLIAAKVAS